MKMIHGITALIEVMATLRTPETGCPFELEQSFASIIPYTIEEAYEVADAIRRGDVVDLCEELGDLLLQVVYHARMAEEQGAFTFHDVVERITQKMHRRHPHIFGTMEERARGYDREQWQKIKAQEKQEKQEKRLKCRETGKQEELPTSFLDEVSPALPPMVEAVKLAKKAATIGFDWEKPTFVFEKITEETSELLAAIKTDDSAEITAEYGDLLFTILNFGRQLNIDPSYALSLTNLKFRNRFSFIEKALHQQGKTLDEASLEEMEELWNRAKTNKLL